MTASAATECRGSGQDRAGDRRNGMEWKGPVIFHEKNPPQDSNVIPFLLCEMIFNRLEEKEPWLWQKTPRLPSESERNGTTTPFDALLSSRPYYDHSGSETDIIWSMVGYLFVRKGLETADGVGNIEVHEADFTLAITQYRRPTQ